jgi:hypothetical protein
MGFLEAPIMQIDIQTKHVVSKRKTDTNNIVMASAINDNII